MSFIDNLYLDGYNQKKSVSVAVVRVGADEIAAGRYPLGGNYFVLKLPPDAIITDAYMHTLSASTAGAVRVGTAEGGSEIMTAGDAGVLGKTGTFTGQSSTGTGVEVYVVTAAAATAGDFIVTIEYLEYTKNTGEYTRV
jgi:hypothetical protein